MKKFIYIFFIGAFVGFSACENEEILNPNSPTVESFEDGATLADLKLLSQGLQAIMRVDANFHFWTTSTIGREYYDLRGTDPRYTTELLGKNGGSLDNNGFLTTRTYFGRYRTIRNAYILQTAVQNTVATLSDSQRSALLGFSNTVIAHEMLLEANRQYENGIRIDVVDPDNLGAFTDSYRSSLAGIKAILDEGYSQLNGIAEDFIFNLEGFSSIPGTETEAMAKFNRAIAARLAVYQEDWSGALSALEDSFFDLDGDLDIGAYYAYGGASGNDLANPYFYVPGVDFYMAHPTFVEDAEDGDGRLSKVTEVTPVAIDDLSSPYQVTIYSSNTDDAIIIRNEELIMIFAEASFRNTSEDDAITAINVARTAAGLDAVDGISGDDLFDQLVYERRYSLFGEGHRWIDLRRWGRLDELPIDRPGDIVHVQFPRPANEAE
jgi:hypothetical protein